MCGIAGIFHLDRNRAADPVVLKKMTDILRHRGPDGEGHFVKENIGLGHRRLSIIDLQTGDQPMFNDDKSIALVLNGEIYNFVELREELKNLGHHFRTTSDTEVVIRAYEQWGTGCQDKFNGMWAFALWDDRRKQLFLSRDRIGEKPLAYAFTDQTLVFSSEMKSIFEYGIRPEIRTELIEVYLVTTNIPGPDTFYKDIFKLMPGHYLLAGEDGIKVHKYWDLPEIDETNMLTDKEAVYEEFASLFQDSVRIRMRSDVSYGAFLSGGLDSSSIVALMSDISPFPVETFTIGFPEKEFDESSPASEVASRFHTQHNQGSVSRADFRDFISKSAFHFDEPFGDSSAIPTWQVSNFARKKVKMALTGDGGDELLSGYRSYSGIKFSILYSKLPLFVQKSLPAVVGFTASGLTGSPRYKLNRVKSVFETARLPFPERMANKQSYISISHIKKLTSTIKNKINAEDYYHDIIAAIPYQDEFYKLMYLNFKYDLPNDYLVKVDRMSMANSLETRAPFLDPRLIEFMVRVDKRVKLQGWERKSILRKTTAKRLPENLLKAPKKGFGIPLREWFKEGNISQSYDFKGLRKLFDERTLDGIIEENAKGTNDYGNFIWTLIMLDCYTDRW
jgi:asparagine synthase (glutamine-hydrolysing)